MTATAPMFAVTESDAVAEAWRAWTALAPERYHLSLGREGSAPLAELRQALATAHDTAERCAADLPEGFRPAAVLDMGCSIGIKVVALAQRFPGAEVCGLDPDREALMVARAMAARLPGWPLRLVQGYGESLPFADASFDLVVSHTVIEHVRDVDACLGEIARVLRPGGRLHLEAPNYVWPYEPHLEIWMPPLCPKPLARSLARLQGRGARRDYVDHLQLVHPRWIERAFRANGLAWENRFATKMRAVMGGDFAALVKYRRLGRLLALLRRLGAGPAIVRLALATALYPSLLYTARKPD